jgi:hypothetical protein
LAAGDLEHAAQLFRDARATAADASMPYEEAVAMIGLSRSAHHDVPGIEDAAEKVLRELGVSAPPPIIPSDLLK